MSQNPDIRKEYDEMMKILHNKLTQIKNIMENIKQ